MNYKPKLILLGLDTWVFNDEWNKQVWDYETYREIHSANRSRGAVLKQAIQDWRSKKWAFGDLRNYPQNIGSTDESRMWAFFSMEAIIMGTYTGRQTRSRNASLRIR